MFPFRSASLVKKYGCPGSCYNERSEKRDIQKLCGVAKQQLQHNYNEVVRNHDPNMVLTKFYSSDGTPLLLNRCWTRFLRSRKIFRHGNECQEYLVDRTFLKNESQQGDITMTVAFREPLPLRQGKTAWHLLACQQASTKSLRAELGYMGPLIEHYVWDRGYFSAMDKLTRKFHKKKRMQLVRT